MAMTTRLHSPVPRPTFFRPRVCRPCIAATVSGAAAALLALAGCERRSSPQESAVPGEPPSLGTRTLEAGAALMQTHAPVTALNSYLDGFHFAAGDPGMQVEAHHYCNVLSEDLIQCVIFDGNGERALLMGVEYIVSARQFAQLPAEEKALWHSHVHEVKSGQLVAPGIPQVAEHALMDKLVSTYGKTWHTWHGTAQAALPLGTPQLMMGFTADGQLDPALLQARDQRLKVDSAARRQDRADLPSPPIDPLADTGPSTAASAAHSAASSTSRTRAASSSTVNGLPIR